MHRIVSRSLLSASTKAPITSGVRCLSQEAMDKFKFLEVKEAKPFVYSVTLNRPDKKNAMNFEMWDEIKAVFEQLGEDEDCRSIVLAGNGTFFTSGIDVKALTGMASVTTSDDDVTKKCKKLYPLIRHLQDGFTALEKCPKPVIAAIHGGCIGGGIDLITATDIRYCTEDAWFTVKEVDLGLAADVGTLQRLPKVIGNQSLVRELCFTARKFDAAEAAGAGLVSRVLPDRDSCVEAALELADTIAKKSPVAVQGTKQSLVYSRDHTVDEGLEHIAQINKTNLQSNDVMVSAMAMMTRSDEPPTYSKL